ncbi:DUF4136 domain-containing protein [Altererythrobacter endophyticus]|uniref:DUF4136 domain-containing protein n=2 Tax=Altericroceibacterium endophyticum TaxID=1808508 RepID=A0A6I4T2F8_9SPHN|nr:DUF4136 domain-containing protein [Altericroceibacterium endophyticum]
MAGAIALAAALPLGACATNHTTPVEVTRFVGPAPAELGRGTVAVIGAPGADGGSLAFMPYRTAVAEELARLGYTLAGPESAAQIAELRITRQVNAPQRRNSPVNVGVGGSTGSYGSGVGVGIGIDLSGPPPEMVENGIGLIIRDKQTGDALWEGRASFTTKANGEDAMAAPAAQRLAQALFTDFPGESGETFEVK